MVKAIVFWSSIIISSIWLIRKCLAGSSRKVVALGTVMIGTGLGGSVNMLARVSMVNRHRMVIYDEYVKPVAQVTDYRNSRTPWSGIRERDLVAGKDFNVVRQEVARILQDSILVGHGLKYNLDVLKLDHPATNTRDTALFKLFRQLSLTGQNPSLKSLAMEYLQRDIQYGTTSSVEDARAAIDLYLLVEEQWETDLN